MSPYRRQTNNLTLKIASIGLCCFGALLVLAAICRAETITTTLVPALGWDTKKQGTFPVSLVADGAGNIWVGTEGNGLWKYDVAKKDWSQFTTKDGLGDDCVYALALDQLGRIWAGHLNHGVSVYNGDKWKNYGLLDGPIGDRVFSIAVSPKDGDVWIATDMGLSRYSEKRQDWDYYTRASGLPSDQIQSVAFTDDGKVFAGTQCNGIAVAAPEDDYAKWRVTTAPPSLPRTRFGKSLSSDFINDLTNSPIGIIGATAHGIIFTNGEDFSSYLRGEDWSTRNAENGPPPGMFPMERVLPAEDWVTSVGSAGTHLLLGYRASGVDSFSIISGGLLKPEVQTNEDKTHAIRAILPIPGHSPVMATYDASSGGLLTFASAPPYKAAATGATASATAKASPPPLPATPQPPVVQDAQLLSDPLAKFTKEIVPGEAYYLADDWRTEGDWIGRYGSGYVKLCGMTQGDQDYSLQPGYQVRLQVGPHHEENAAGPVSLHDDEISTDLRSLYDPTIGHRRDSQENDFSDNEKIYPESYDGPDLWVRVTVPDSVHCVSLYFLNNDAHTVSDAKYRDYDVTIVPDYGDDDNIESETPLARTRVTDFWGGVYKQFLVCGPASYVVRIGRNRSFGTRLQAVFLDRVTGELTDAPGQLPGFNNVPYAPPDEPDDYHPTPLTDAAVTLWNKLDDDLGLRGAIPLQMPLRIWCYRAAVIGGAPAAILERWRWQISIWTPDDRKKFDDAMKAAYETIK